MYSLINSVTKISKARQDVKGALRSRAVQEFCILLKPCDALREIAAAEKEFCLFTLADCVLPEQFAER